MLALLPRYDIIFSPYILVLLTLQFWELIVNNFMVSKRIVNSLGLLFIKFMYIFYAFVLICLQKII